MGECGVCGQQTTHGVFEQQLIGEIQQAFDGALLVERETGVLIVVYGLLLQFELQHAAPALPCETRTLRCGGGVGRVVHIMCLSMSSRISLMALVGLSPLGQTSTQFMMV